MKSRFDDTYNLDGPQAYARALLELDYREPDFLAPRIKALAAATPGRQSPVKIIDICAGYGFNALGIRAGLFGREALNWLANPESLPMRPRDSLFETPPEIIAMDMADRALAFSQASGLADAAICANLEARALTAPEAALLQGVTHAIATGAFSYITRQTIDRVLDAIDPAPALDLWFWPLAGTDMSAISDMLNARGFTLDCPGELLWQRRYRDDAERTLFHRHFEALGFEVTGSLLEDGLCCTGYFAQRPGAGTP